MLAIYYHILSALALAVGAPATPSTPPEAYGLYVEGSAPRSSDIDTTSSENVKANLPGFNHMLRNQTAIDQMSKNDEDPVLGLQFEDVCRNVALVGLREVGETSLEAKCMDLKGHWWDTTLNLNDCMANDQGLLVYQKRGHFDETCRPCMIDNPAEENGLRIRCSCIDEFGRSQFAFLPLGSDVNHHLAVRPIDGRLVCGDRPGTKTPTF